MLFVGLATLDVIHLVERLPAPDEKLTSLARFLAAGGPAAGAAVTCAALGGRATLATALGAGPVARIVRDDLTRLGVEIFDVGPELADPAVSSVLVLPDGTRTVVGSDAAGTDVPAPARLDELVRGADAVLVDGHHPRLALAAARAAHELHRPCVLDAGRWKPGMAELLPLVSDLVASADFAAPESAVVKVPTQVTTAGPGPVRWRAGRSSGQVAVPPVGGGDAGGIRDTLGAGDAFHGAYALALACRASLEARIRFAIRVAGLRCASLGPRDWLGGVRQACDTLIEDICGETPERSGGGNDG